jgi:hypothetical protein
MRVMIPASRLVFGSLLGATTVAQIITRRVLEQILIKFNQCNGTLKRIKKLSEPVLMAYF